MELTTPLTPALTLRSPLLAAAGTFGFGEEVLDLADSASLGALITPTLTLAPNRGNPMPRTVEAHSGLLHSLGLPNPGLEAFLRDIAPALGRRPYPVLASIWADDPGEWVQLAEALTECGAIAGLELNLCPAPLIAADQSRGALLPEPEELARIEKVTGVVRAATPLPLIAKLPPAGPEIGAAAGAAENAGADAIAVSQALPGVAVRLSAGRFRLPGVVGGLSGPAIKPLALYQVWRAALSVRIPVIGSGGIMTADDALEFLMAGACAVSIGVASIIHPGVTGSISQGIRRFLVENGYDDVASVTGLALR